MKVTTIRLNEKELEELERMARLLSKEKSDLMREALSLGMSEIKLRVAIEAYQRGKFSAGRAAEAAGMTLYEFYTELKRRNINLKYGEENLQEELKKLNLA